MYFPTCLDHILEFSAVYNHSNNRNKNLEKVMSKLRCPSMHGNSDHSVVVQGTGIRVPVEVKQSMNIFISSSASEDGNNVTVILKTRTVKEVQISYLKPCVMHCQITLCYENAPLWGGGCGTVQVKLVKKLETTFTSSYPM
jgi:hypothetical protein